MFAQSRVDKFACYKYVVLGKKDCGEPVTYAATYAERYAFRHTLITSGKLLDLH